MDHQVTLTLGHVLRHAPSKGGGGLEAAVIDIAQDLLLRHLHEAGVMDALAFKGGTALRKLHAGAAGRFSTDLDFAVRHIEDAPDDVVARLVEAIEGAHCGPFRYGIRHRRGKPHLTIESDLGRLDVLTCKLDVGPPPWLSTSARGWVPMPIHERYGGALPTLHVIRLEENMAEKIARLNRVTPARDAHDLVWILGHASKLGHPLDHALVRRLAVLKVWVDKHGLRSSGHRWQPAHEPQPLDVESWLRVRLPRDFDDGFIGLLTSPPPELDDLGRALSAGYAFLRDLTPEEKQVARCNGRDRPLVLRLLAECSPTRLPQGGCW